MVRWPSSIVMMRKGVRGFDLSMRVFPAIVEQRSKFPLSSLVLGRHKFHQVVRLSLPFVSSAKALTKAVSLDT